MKKKKNLEIIEEIHNAFYSDSDYLIEYQNESVPLSVDEQSKANHERLSKFGFNNTEYRKKVEIQNVKNWENEEKLRAKKAFNYFRSKYPLYKFITKSSVERICKKYDLVYGKVDRYIGNVPEKNIREIENFKIEDMDKCFIEDRFGVRFNISFANHLNSNNNNSSGYIGVSSESPLEIVCSYKDFDTSGMKIEEYHLVIDDPIVLQPVFYKGDKYYLIVTAWGGDEAIDKDVINQKMN